MLQLKKFLIKVVIRKMWFNIYRQKSADEKFYVFGDILKIRGEKVSLREKS